MKGLKCIFFLRAEFRVHLRPDNADLRLTQKAIDAGIAAKEREEAFSKLKGIVY